MDGCFSAQEYARPGHGSSDLYERVPVAARLAAIDKLEWGDCWDRFAADVAIWGRSDRRMRGASAAASRSVLQERSGGIQLGGWSWYFRARYNTSRDRDKRIGYN